MQTSRSLPLNTSTLRKVDSPIGPGKNQIIEALFKGKNFNDCIGRIEPPHLREDLKQEIILIVCEWPAERVIKLHQDKALEFFVVRTILNQIKSNTSPFFRKFRVRFAELTNQEVAEEIDFDERIEREQIQDRAISEIDNLYWYNAGLIKLYAEHGNYRAIEEHTGIPFISCYKTIKKSFEELRNRAIDPAARPVKINQNVR